VMKVRGLENGYGRYGMLCLTGLGFSLFQHKKKKLTSKTLGFSLVEMAIVLLVFGLIIGGLMGPLKTQMDRLDRKETLKEISLIKESMVGFALRNGRIPCPDTDNDGIEDTSGGNCANELGNVPWATLGVGRYDGWKRPFTYRVDDRFADTSDGSGCADTDVAGVSFELCSTGDISVLASQGGATVASNVPAVIVSHGKNWAQTAGSDEAENQDSDADFVDKTYVIGGSNDYDDIVDWLNLNNLIVKMVQAERLP